MIVFIIASFSAAPCTRLKLPCDVLTRFQENSVFVCQEVFSPIVIFLQLGW